MTPFSKRLIQAWHVLLNGLPEVIVDPPPSPPSPIDQKLAADCADLLNEYNAMLPRMNDAVRPFAENVVDRLQEMLERNGLDAIDGETNFDIVRHKAEPAKNVPQGTPILETLTPGLALGAKVLRRAKVRVE